MKQVTVEAMFPELKGGSIYKTGRGRASTTKAAISRAFGDLLKQVRGKRIHSITATLTIIEVQETQNEAFKYGQNTLQRRKYDTISIT